jgi:hypothetical protein
MNQLQSSLPPTTTSSLSLHQRQHFSSPPPPEFGQFGLYRDGFHGLMLTSALLSPLISSTRSMTLQKDSLGEIISVFSLPIIIILVLN